MPCNHLWVDFRVGTRGLGWGLQGNHRKKGEKEGEGKKKRECVRARVVCIRVWIASCILCTKMSLPPTRARGESSRPSSNGSDTITVQGDNQVNGRQGGACSNIGTLRLRATDDDDPQRPRQRLHGVVWTDDTVDNEGCGKKKSKSA